MVSEMPVRGEGDRRAMTVIHTNPATDNMLVPHMAEPVLT